MLVRLDVDSKLPEALRLAFACCPSEAKASILLHLLRNTIQRDELTLVFAATMHHVEYLHLVGHVPPSFYTETNTIAAPSNSDTAKTC